jgi:thiol-disulfide isomerase/thioredoxin
MQMRRTVALVLVLFAVVSCKRTEQAVSQTSATDTATRTQTQPPQETATTAAGQTDVGRAMPEYTALDLDGAKFDMAAKRDKVVLLNVWATWCGPCVYEIPELQKIHEKYSAQGLEVIGVSVDETSPETVREFVAEQKKMTYPIIHDTEGKIATLLETTVLPTSIVVDRKGQIVWKKYGAIMEGDEELKKAIEAAL